MVYLVVDIALAASPPYGQPFVGVALVASHPMVYLVVDIALAHPTAYLLWV